jgi:hypothetical protein
MAETDPANEAGWRSELVRAGSRAEQDYCSAFGLSLRVVVGRASGVQRGQTPALVGVLRLTPAGPP